MSFNPDRLFPIKCFTCGNVLSQKYQYYCEQLLEQKKDLKKTEYLTKETVEKTVEGKLLDDLDIINICCRKHMLTHQ
uniref:DNA-directed RNA polymerase n=1 Tax=viral metagenome TaxID=1070528 RepID=A0A6C0H6L9_9ZZZZ